MEAKLIRDIVREVGEAPVRLLLEIEIAKLATLVNVAHNITKEQIPFIAETLLSTYPTESLADFILVFKRGAIGFYGTTYHELDCGIIINWMGRHIEEKSMYRERDNSNSKKAEVELGEIDYDAYRKKIAMKEESEREEKRNKIIKADELAQSKLAYVPDPELQTKHDLHLKWIRENYDSHTGKPKKEWLCESEWLKRRRNRKE